MYIVYVIVRAAYGVLFTCCFCQKPERARHEQVRAFDTNNSVRSTFYVVSSLLQIRREFSLKWFSERKLETKTHYFNSNGKYRSTSCKELKCGTEFHLQELVYCSMRDWTRFCWGHRIRCGFFFFTLESVD